MLLAVTEDSATLRSDMSAVYGVGGESDAIDIALFFVALHHPASLSLEILKAKNLGSGQSPMHRRCLTHQISDTPFRLRMDSLQSITRG